MKKSSLLLVASMFTVLMMNAQNEQESPQEETTPKTGAGTEYVLGLGFNALNNSGAVFEDLTNSDHWAFGGVPVYLSVETNIASKWKAKAILSHNWAKDGKVVDGSTILGESEGGNDMGYLAFDVAANYYFLGAKTYEPYVSLGMGVSHFGDFSSQENPSNLVDPTDVFTYNVGLGLNVWFSDQWGLNLNTLGKWGVGSSNTNHHQTSLGVLYKI